MNSLDPRVNRLPFPEQWGELKSKQALDQLETYEVFHQSKLGKAYEHVGIVHAPNEEMAFIFAKEQYSRRGTTCSGLWTVNTSKVMVTPLSENGQSIYDLFEGQYTGEGIQEAFDIFHLKKRGKQHVHAGMVMAGSYDDALALAQQQLNDGKTVFNIWIIKQADMFRTEADLADIWDTLHEKTYRDAIEYKGQDKINKFKAEQAIGN